MTFRGYTPFQTFPIVKEWRRGVAFRHSACGASCWGRLLPEESVERKNAEGEDEHPVLLEEGLVFIILLAGPGALPGGCLSSTTIQHILVRLLQLLLLLACMDGQSRRILGADTLKIDSAILNCSMYWSMLSQLCLPASTDSGAGRPWVLSLHPTRCTQAECNGRSHPIRVQTDGHK